MFASMWGCADMESQCSEHAGARYCGGRNGSGGATVLGTQSVQRRTVPYSRHGVEAGLCCD